MFWLFTYLIGIHKVLYPHADNQSLLFHWDFAVRLFYANLVSFVLDATKMWAALANFIIFTVLLKLIVCVITFFMWLTDLDFSFY